MNFTEFIGQNHPDPDSLLNAKFDQLCKLAEDYAEYKQLLQSRVVGQSEQFTSAEIVNQLNQEETIDDAKMYYQQKIKV